MSENEYKRSCEDELDWKDIDQLHEAILQISKSCFEYKKICIGFLGVAFAFIFKLTNNILDQSLFYIGLIICIGFWIADSTSYFFQRKLRNILDKKMIAIAKRSSTITYCRDITQVSWGDSFFNSSMSLYYVLIIFLVCGWLCLLFEVIK